METGKRSLVVSEWWGERKTRWNRGDFMAMKLIHMIL